MEAIEYFEIPEMPGQRMFRCGKLSATISDSTCAKLWTSAADGGERNWRCKGCLTGAKHAGVGDATLSPLHKAPICARCQRGSTRLIQGHICVSCANRQYEKLKGRNARGNTPITHPELYTISIRYMTDARVKLKTRTNSVSMTELVIGALRDEPKQVTFCLAPPPRPALPQLELF